MTNGIAWITHFEPVRGRPRWLAAVAGSVAFHAAAAICLWPTIEEFAIGNASGATVIAFDLASIEDASEERPTAAPPAAAQPAPHEIQNAQTESVAEIQPEPATIEELAPAFPAVVHPSPSRKPTPTRQPKPTDVPVESSRHETQDATDAPAQTATEGTPTQTTALTASTPRISSVAEPIVVLDPKFVRQPSPPTYPARAVELDQQGVVFIRALVIVPGKPEKTVVWQSSGFPLLDSAAIAAVSRWEFEPLRRAGEAWPAWVQVPVKFRLNQTTIQ